MVQRRLNKPVAKIGAYPLFWFREVSVVWSCRKCSKQQVAGSVATEICVRYAGKGLTKDQLKDQFDKAVKMYLCLSCTEEVLTECIDNVRMCKTVGAEGYMLFTKV